MQQTITVDAQALRRTEARAVANHSLTVIAWALRPMISSDWEKMFVKSKHLPTNFFLPTPSLDFRLCFVVRVESIQRYSSNNIEFTERA